MSECKEERESVYVCVTMVEYVRVIERQKEKWPLKETNRKKDRCNTKVKMS